MDNKVIIYNPAEGAEINDIYARKTWKHKVNTLVRYPRQLADYLLKKYGFLVEVEPKNLLNIKSLIEAKYKCNFKGCNYVTDSPQKLRMHKMGKHKITKEISEQISQIKEAEPTGDVEVAEGVKRTPLSPEQLEGIPDTKRGEKDGWYGGGWEEDQIGSNMMKKKQPGVTPGHFK